MRFLLRSALIIVLLSGFYSCYTVRYNIGHTVGKETAQVQATIAKERYKQQASWLLWGLLPIEQPDVASAIKKTQQKGSVVDARIEAEFDILDYIVSFLTVGIWVPRTVYVEVYYAPYKKKVVPKQEKQPEQKQQKQPLPAPIVKPSVGVQKQGTNKQTSQQKSTAEPAASQGVQPVVAPTKQVAPQNSKTVQEKTIKQLSKPKQGKSSKKSVRKKHLKKQKKVKQRKKR